MTQVFTVPTAKPVITHKEHVMHRILLAATTVMLFATPIPVLADDMGMSMGGPKSATAATENYRFELAGPVQQEGSGKSVVAVRLVHGGKPVTGAIIIQSRADMGPIGMAGMTAPITSLGEQPPGTYRFEIENGSVWKKPDNWSLSFSAKVQGVTQTVTGSITTKLVP